MNTEYDWLRLYKAAILETDWSKIEGHIQAAESGVKARLHDFSMNHGGTPEENRAIEHALNGLNTAERSSRVAGIAADGLAGIKLVCSVPCRVRGGAHSFLRIRQFLLG